MTLLFLLMGNCASCWVTPPPTLHRNVSMGVPWVRGSHMPSQTNGSLRVSFLLPCCPYSGIPLGPPSIPLYQPVLLASLVMTLCATVDERKSVRCQAQGHSGVTLSLLCALSIEVAPKPCVPNTPQRFWRNRLY